MLTIKLGGNSHGRPLGWEQPVVFFVGRKLTRSVSAEFDTDINSDSPSLVGTNPNSIGGGNRDC